MARRALDPDVWPLGRVLLLRFVFVVPFGGCLLASWLGCARLVTNPLAYALAMIVGATISLVAGLLVAVAVDEMVFTGGEKPASQAP